MMKHILCAITVALACSGCGGDKAPQKEIAVAVDTVPMMVMQIQKCSRLYTAEYNVRKIVTHDDVMRLKGNIMNTPVNIKLPVGDRKIAIPISARLKPYIDFSQFSDKNIERDGDKITIILPDPKVALTSSSVDRRTSVSMWRLHAPISPMPRWRSMRVRGARLYCRTFSHSVS